MGGGGSHEAPVLYARPRQFRLCGTSYDVLSVRPESTVCAPRRAVCELRYGPPASTRPADRRLAPPRRCCPRITWSRSGERGHTERTLLSGVARGPACSASP